MCWLGCTQGVDSELDAYHLIIGAEGNTKVVLQRDFEAGYIKEKDTPGILHCNTSNPFWLSWKDNLIELGE